MENNTEKDNFFYSYFFKKDEINVNNELIMITSRDNVENDLIRNKIEEIKTNIQNIQSDNINKIDRSRDIDDNIDCKYSDDITPLTDVPSIKIRIKCNKIYDVIYIIKKFKEYGFLNEMNDKYFLNNGLEFNWKNLNELKIDDDNLFTKIIFWYFRKIAVDSIVYDIVEYYKNKVEYNCKKINYVGAGSNHISSDYDITLSGTNNKCTARIIYKYYKIIKNIFKETSEIVFDTNLYGTDFIDHTSESQLKVIETDNSECIYDNSVLNVKLSINPIFEEIFTPRLESEVSTIEKSMSTLALNTSSISGKEESDELSNKRMCDKIDQRVWAYIKFLLNYKKKMIKNKSDIQDVFKGKIIWEKAIEFLFNNPKDDSEVYSTYYGLLILMSDKLIKKYNINNYISLVNYYGNETYFTRGAFIDVVVNQQILKNKNIIKLDNDDYINSFIENISDYIYHDFKQKYLERCESISSKLNGKFDDIILFFKKNENLSIDDAYNKIIYFFKQLDDQDLNKT